MSGLVLCSSCSRHVRASERTCPFCNEAQPAVRPPAPTYAKPLSRAAIVFASATAITACGKTQKDDPPQAVTLYGVPPIDAGNSIVPITLPDEASTTFEPHGEVEVGALKMMTTGKLADGERVMKDLHGRIRGCYTRGLVNNPSMQGKVTLSVKVAANGEVLEAKVSEKKDIDSLPADCMAAVIKKARFAAPGAAGASFTVRITCTTPDGG